MLLISILLIVLLLLSTSMLGNARGAASRPVYRWMALAAVGQATLFFGYGLVRPADPIDAWGFQQFYGVFCVLVVVSASVFIQKEYRAPARPVETVDDADAARTPPKPAASIPRKPREPRPAVEPARGRGDERR